jgi:transposase
MSPEEELRQLRAENAALRHENAARREQLAALREQVTSTAARLAELEQRSQRRGRAGKAAAPQPAAPRGQRRARAPEANGGRPRMEPTATQIQQYAHCPDCGYRLRGGSEAYRRQVIEIPPPPPPVVTEHVFIRRWCPCCAKWRTPPLPAGLALGASRFGVGLASLVATLRTALRLPFAQIQAYLAAVHRVAISQGALADLVRRVHGATQPAIAGLLAQARAAPILHGDETGWREDGRHGYVWVLTTPGPQPLVYFERDPSRGQAVLARLLGPQFAGVLVSDFYAGYNGYAGRHQRCWAHLLRDLHQLREAHAGRAAVGAWARAVGRLYRWAQAFLAAPGGRSPAARQAAYARLVATSQRLALRYAQAKGHPCQALAKRLARHQHELFQFVLVPGLSADNNLAERRLRPLVVARKISGGTRSAEGSAIRMGLASLLATFQARGLNPFTALVALLVALTAQA